LIDLALTGTPGVEFSLAHRDDPTQTARVGIDPRRGGIYAEVEWNGVLVVLDADDVDPDRDPVVEILSLLIDFGFLQPRALQDVRTYRDTPSCWRSSRPPRRVRRVVRIVEELVRAAGT